MGFQITFYLSVLIIMKKRELRGLVDLPKVSKITRPGAVTQIQIFKLQNPSVRSAYHPSRWLAPPCWTREAPQPSQGPSEREGVISGGPEAVISAVKQDFLTRAFKSKLLGAERDVVEQSREQSPESHDFSSNTSSASSELCGQGHGHCSACPCCSVLTEQQG